MKEFDVFTTSIKYRGVRGQNKTFNEEESRHKFEFDAMYLDKQLGHSAEDFESMSSEYSKNKDDDGGLFTGGVTYRAPGDLRFRLWDHYFEDTFNDVYVDGRYHNKITEDVKMMVNLSYLDWKETGDTNAGELDTWQVGGDIGVSAYAFYGNYDTPDVGENASRDYDQIDFDLQYKLGGWFKGCHLRLRYVIRNADDNIIVGIAEDLHDLLECPSLRLYDILEVITTQSRLTNRICGRGLEIGYL